MSRNIDLHEWLGLKTKVRDPLYGYIWLTDDEVEIIDTPIFQRLRRVNQLALTKYVYPAAEHSRFVHSLGAMHCATQIFCGIISNEKSSNDICSYDIVNMLKRLRYAALLHDIGHVAFSHAAENEILTPLHHEALGQYIIENYAPIAKVLGDHAKYVSGILSDTVLEDYMLLHQIISGHLDADRADYLMRDSYSCGVKYGEYDFQRYMQAFGAVRDDGLKLFVNERDIFVVESFLVARHHYNMQVPYHRTRMGFDLVLKRFLSEFLPTCEAANLGLEHQDGRFTRVDLDAFEWFDDYSIFDHIKREARVGNKWAGMLLRQGHLCPVYDTTDAVDKSGRIFKRCIEKLRKRGFVENENFFYCREQVKASKLTVTDEKGKTTPAENRETIFVRTKGGKMVDIVDHSHIVLALRPVTIYRIYTTQDRKVAAESIIRSVDKIKKGER